MRFKLGLKPVQQQPRLRLADYLKPSDLPAVTDLTFPVGHADAIQPQMFCNDRIGDCAIAGSIEEIRLANALAGVSVPFTDNTAIVNYSTITGYNPDDPDTDQGTDVHDLFEFRRQYGIVDDAGNRHKVRGYAGLTPGDFGELLIALSLFDMVGIGVQVPTYVHSLFDAGEPWDVQPGQPQIEGGHYIPIVGATDQQTAQFYTWGALTSLTARFYQQFNTVAVVALTDELFKDGKTPEGFDADKLAQDLPELNTGQVI